MVNRLYPTFDEREFGENPKQYPLLYAGFVIKDKTHENFIPLAILGWEGSIGKVRKPAIRNIRSLGIKTR